jgi:hypothetical protein
MARTFVKLPFRPLPQKLIADAKKLLKQHPDPLWVNDTKMLCDRDWLYAVMVLDLQKLERRQPLFAYEVQAFRIGDSALVTMMGEPFVEGQLHIKRHSPAAQTFVAHMCNGYAGYLPTKEAFTRGGYETRTGTGSRMRPDALMKVSNTAVRLLKKVMA